MLWNSKRIILFHNMLEEVLNSYMSAQGLFTLPCAGHFKNGAREGRGRCAYADGSQYEGDWVADKRQGQGICIYANGDKYKGRMGEQRCCG